MISFNYNEYNRDSLKRKSELKEENQSNKFQKNNSKSEQIIQDLAYSCFRSTPILKYLSHIDLLSFEKAALSHSEITQQAWARLRKKECHQLEWKMCSNEPNKDKWNYRLERALSRYVEIFPEVLSLENHITPCTIENNLDKDLNEYSFKLAQKYETIQKLFVGLSEEFQVWQDFINYNVRFSKEKPFSLQEKIDESVPLCGEDLLIAITNYRDNLLTLEGFQKVINKGATLTALIAYKFIYNHKMFPYLDWNSTENEKNVKDNLREMVILAVEKNDFRALEYIIQTRFNFDVEANNPNYKATKLVLKELQLRYKRPLAPITASLAKIEADIQKKSKLYDQALEEYKQAKKLAPLDTLFENIEAKKELLFKQDEQSIDVQISLKQIGDHLSQIEKILIKEEKEKDPSFSIDKNNKRLASQRMRLAIIKCDLGVIEFKFAFNKYQMIEEEDSEN